MEDAGFIISFKPYQHKQKGVYYRVIDEYTLFYLKWIEPIKKSLAKRSLTSGYWEKLKFRQAGIVGQGLRLNQFVMNIYRKFKKH